MAFSHRLRIQSEVDGQVLSRFEERASSRYVTAPSSVHLRAGEVARNIPIAIPLPSNGSPVASYVLVATDRPGVRARLSRLGTTQTCRASGNLLTGTEVIKSQVQNGSVTPSFVDGGSWVNHQSGSTAPYQYTKFAQNTNPDPVNYSDEAWRSTYNSSQVAISMYVWGRDDYVDLGGPDDGKEFRFWYVPYASETLSAITVTFSSYPFGTDNNDTSPAAYKGTVDDVEIVADAPPTGADGYYWRATVTSQASTSPRRNLFVINKSDFTAGGGGTPAPAWNRITSLRIQSTLTSSAAPSNYSGGSAIYFGDPPNAVVNSVALLSQVVSTRTGLTLSLDAPEESDANVTILASIS